jgi:hypothetical protein
MQVVRILVESMRIWRLIVCGLAIFQIACVEKTPRPAVRAMTVAPASAAERLARLPKVLPSFPSKLLTRVEEADWAIEQIGDGVLGPSDFITRARLQVPRADAVEWLAGERTGKLEWTKPAVHLEWWITPELAARAVFVERQNASLAVLPDAGVVYLVTSTQ